MTFGATPNRDGAELSHAHASASRTDSARTVQSDTSRRVRGDSRNSSSNRSEQNENLDWLQDQALKRTRAQIANATGLTPRGAENIRLGDSKISFDALVEWCRNDPLFRAEFFKHCGGHLETSPIFYAHMSQAINAYMVTTQQGMAD